MQFSTLVLIIAIIYLVYLIYSQYNSYLPLPIIEHLDLSRYQGKWYEIARLPNYFQTGCENTTAEYTLNKDGTLTVINRCQVNNKMIEIKGIARPSTRSPSSLDVYFGYSFIAGEYTIIYVDSDYQVALVGTTNRKNLWILSKTPNINQNIFQELVYRARELGFDVDKLIK